MNCDFAKQSKLAGDIDHNLEKPFRSSSVVEQSAVNRSAAGSNPACGANHVLNPHIVEYNFHGITWRSHDGRK